MNGSAVRPATVASGKTVRRANKSSGKDTKKRKGKVSSSERSGDSSLAAIGGRDTSLFLFRALGKILYCKRNDPKEFADQPVLPVHLEQHYRDPLQVVPEEVIEKSQLSAEFFTAYLHQNYLDFYGQLDDVVTASDYLSDADYLTTDWANRSVLRHYAASVAARALMFCNTSRAKHGTGGSSGLGWKPLHKPQCFAVQKKYRENCLATRDLFREWAWTTRERHTQLIPYLGLLNKTLRNPGQISFVQEVGKFTISKYPERREPERLNEMDVASLQDDVDDSQSENNFNETTRQTDAASVGIDGDVPSSQDRVKSVPAESEAEDDPQIDDFDW